VATIEARDGDLARQMRRAMASVALNIAEGQGSRGGNQRARFATALGSMRETKACIDVAEASVTPASRPRSRGSSTASAAPSIASRASGAEGAAFAHGALVFHYRASA
jgi:hypothetical protein